MRQFQQNLRQHVRQVQADLPQAPPELTAPEFLQDALNELRLLLKSYDSSLTPPPEKETEFMPILEEALDPYLKGCESLANDLQSPSSHIFMINCLLASKETLQKFTFTEGRIAELDKSLESRASALVEHIHQYILEASGLKPLLNALAEWDSSVRNQCIPFPSYYANERQTTPLSEVSLFSPQSLGQISEKLDGFLPSAAIDAQSQLQRLASPKTVAGIITQATDAFVDEFALIEETFVGDNGVEYARDVWPRTIDEVRVLLG